MSLAGIEEEGTVSVCALRAGEARFAIATAQVREVLEGVRLRRVPLAPGYIAGVAACRGEILTVVSLRALLGLDGNEGESCALVLDDGSGGEAFALVADRVEGVFVVREDAWEPSLGISDGGSAVLSDGVYRAGRRLMVRLPAERLRPEWLAGSGLLAAGAAPGEGLR